MNLKFDATTLAFNRGTNTTIRRFGSGLHPGECTIYSVDAKGDHRFLYHGKITSIQIFRLIDVPARLLKIHHLGDMTKDDQGGYLYPPPKLLKAVRKYYPDIHPEEIVQVISFMVFFCDADGEPGIPF